MTREARPSPSPYLMFALALPLIAAKGPRLPVDAPYCAAPGAAQLFVSPMGEPFRAPAGQPYPSAAWVAAADRNHDGAIDRAEFLADAARFFRRIDLDHDGKLTPEEVAAYERDVAPEIAVYTGRPDMIPTLPRGGGGGIADMLGLGSSDGGAASGYGGPMGAGRYAWLNVPEPVAAADADVDRLVSAAEFAAAAGRRFDALDTAGRGALRLAELPKTPAQAAIEGPCRPRPKRARDERDRRDAPDTRADIPT